jgi:argininosuccinate lyase
MGSLYRSRLTGKFDEETSSFVSSLKEDERIFEEDVDGTEAHDIMLFEQGLITEEELRRILFALEKLRSEWKRGEVELGPEAEDIHEFVEAYVIEEIGVETGGKLHTGRSRNDQVALDIRMRLRIELNETLEMVLSLVETLLKAAEDHVDTLMLLYTHTQPAQIGVFSHYLLAYADMLLRDFQRLQDCYGKVNLNPLGAGPIGGSSLNLNRKRTTSLLGFEGILENSIDAVSSKDFALEAASALAILMSTLSRVAEDFVLWSSAEFKYLEVADEYASVSSVMPQKKNPCTLELIRGKTGKVYGALTNLLTAVKGLPTGYSRDLQETKTPLWESLETVKTSLRILAGVVSTVKVNKGVMREAASESYAFAVDLAERLVEAESLSFREAHKLVGNLVKEMLASGVKPRNLKPEMLETLAERVLEKSVSVSGEVVESVVEVESCLSRRKTLGSPARGEVKRMIKARRRLMTAQRKRLASQVGRLEESRKNLTETVKKNLSK